MVRRNIFQPPPPPDKPTDPAKPRFPNTGAMTGVKSTLKELSSNAVRDIAPDMIDEGGPQDRLTFSDADVAALADSIRTHGQQVPIMVRPLPDRPGHYRIVYGRRRLRALRLLGQPAKALVRALSDEEAVLAQGQENSQRLDPSFIEKARFAASLAAGGYEPPVIMDALAIDKPMLSRMNKVAREIPDAVVALIGPAHGIGRRRWEELADAVRDRGLDLAELAGSVQPFDGMSSDARFSALAEAVARAQRMDAQPPSPALAILTADGSPLAELRDSPRALTLKLSKTANADFVHWLRDNAEAELTRLFDAWRAAQD